MPHTSTLLYYNLSASHAADISLAATTTTLRVSAVAKLFTLQIVRNTQRMFFAH